MPESRLTLNFLPRYNVNRLTSPRSRYYTELSGVFHLRYLQSTAQRLDQLLQDQLLQKSMKGVTHCMKEAYIQKQAIIDEIKDKFERAESAVVIDYMGITVEQADAMRKKLREAEVDYTVYKNTLVKRAIAGTDYEKMAEVLEGPSAFAFSYSDATAPARVLNESIKEFKKMEFKGGFVEGDYYDKEGIVQIADIPSRDVLISKFMGSIQSPIANFARVVKQIAEKEEA